MSESVLRRSSRAVLLCIYSTVVTWLLLWSTVSAQDAVRDEGARWLERFAAVLSETAAATSDQYSEATYTYTCSQFREGQRRFSSLLPDTREFLAGFPPEGVLTEERIVNCCMHHGRFSYSVLQVLGKLRDGSVTRNSELIYDGQYARLIHFGTGKKIADYRDTRATFDYTSDLTHNPGCEVPDMGQDCWGMIRGALGLNKQPANAVRISKEELSSLARAATIVNDGEDIVFKVESGNLVRLVTLDKVRKLPIAVTIVSGVGGSIVTEIKIEYGILDAPLKGVAPSSVQWSVFANDAGAKQMALQMTVKTISQRFLESAPAGAFDISEVTPPSISLLPFVAR